MKPLHATRILDLTRLLPGAVCTMLLRDLGAEIIKIEDPNGGDYARWMPPLIDGQGAFFRASNRGKKSVVIDLKAEAGKAVLHRLVETADVLIEGFRPGVTARLGRRLRDAQRHQSAAGLLLALRLGAERTLCAGQRARPQLHRAERRAGRGAESAYTPGAQVADVGGAYVAVMGILAALLKRQQTGRRRIY